MQLDRCPLRDYRHDEGVAVIRVPSDADVGAQKKQKQKETVMPPDAGECLQEQNGRSENMVLTGLDTGSDGPTADGDGDGDGYTSGSKPLRSQQSNGHFSRGNAWGGRGGECMPTDSGAAVTSVVVFVGMVCMPIKTEDYTCVIF